MIPGTFWLQKIDILFILEILRVISLPSTLCNHFINSRNDAAIIMYTSGSTGVPKGVILTHKNIFSTLISITRTLDVCGPPFNAGPNDTYLAFLPVAHVLELLCESIMLLTGIKIGYSTPNTLTDTGT